MKDYSLESQFAKSCKIQTVIPQAKYFSRKGWKVIKGNSIQPGSSDGEESACNAGYEQKTHLFISSKCGTM